MTKCSFCNLSIDDEKWLLFEGNLWKVYLSDKQDYIGRCIVVVKRHCESISNLTNEEWNELKIIMNSLEKLLQDILGATMFNWTCLMNDTYKMEIPCPHIHFHLRPRYRHAVTINKKQYIDEEFAHHYINSKENKLNFENIKTLHKVLLSNINKRL